MIERKNRDFENNDDKERGKRFEVWKEYVEILVVFVKNKIEKTNG